jgi:hypothetical protein
MKIASRILSLLILVLVSTFYMGCNKEDKNKETDEKRQLDKLKGLWILQDATMDSDSRTAEFTDTNGPLKLTLDGNYAEGGVYNYSFTGTRPDPSPWPANGEWKFGTNKLTELTRDPGEPDEIAMTYQVTDANLIISFSVPDGSEGWAGGTSRVESVTGNWTFTFTK